MCDVDHPRGGKNPTGHRDKRAGFIGSETLASSPSPGPQRGDSHSEGLGRGPGKCSLPSRPPGGSGVGGGCPHAQHRSPTELKPGARQLHTQQRCSRGGRWPRPSPKFLCPAPTAAAWSTGWGLTWPESGVFLGTGCHFRSFCQHKVSSHVILFGKKKKKRVCSCN